MPLTPELTTLLVTALVKYGPEAFTAIVAVFKKDNPTLEDIEAIVNIVNTPLHPKK
jgi:hypothetical protein